MAEQQEEPPKIPKIDRVGGPLMGGITRGMFKGARRPTRAATGAATSAGENLQDRIHERTQNSDSKVVKGLGKLVGGRTFLSRHRRP